MMAKTPCIRISSSIPGYLCISLIVTWTMFLLYLFIIMMIICGVSAFMKCIWDVVSGKLFWGVVYYYSDCVRDGVTKKRIHGHARTVHIQIHVAYRPFDDSIVVYSAIRPLFSFRRMSGLELIVSNINRGHETTQTYTIHGVGSFRWIRSFAYRSATKAWLRNRCQNCRCFIYNTSVLGAVLHPALRLRCQASRTHKQSNIPWW